MPEWTLNSRRSSSDCVATAWFVRANGGYSSGSSRSRVTISSEAEGDKPKAKLKKIGVLRLAELHAVVTVFVGLVAGIFYSFGGAIYDIATTSTVNLETAMAILALVGMPIIFLIFGFIVGIIETPLYNLIARRFGGMEIDFEMPERVDG